MFSDTVVVKGFQKLNYPAFQAGVFEGTEAYVLFLPGDDEPEEETLLSLRSLMEDPRVMIAFGRPLASVTSGKLTKAVLQAVFPDQSRIFGPRDFYLEGKRLMFLSGGAPVLLRREALRFFYGLPGTSDGLLFFRVALRILFSGFSIGYSAEASVEIRRELTGRKLRRFFFRLGYTEKHEIQTFGWNIPLTGARTMNSSETVIWPDTAVFIKQCTDCVTHEFKAQKHPFSMLRALFTGNVVKCCHLLGKKYLYLPQKTVDRLLRAGESDEILY